MKENPNVSIIIPTYNRAHLVGRSIQSVLNQTYKDFELIIIDDDSIDNTEDIIKEYQKKDKRIKYLKHVKNKGGSAARNTGIKAAKGKYIALLDSDDEWLPEKIDKQVKEMKNLSSDIWGGIYCGFYYANSKNKMGEPTKKGNLKKEILNREVNLCAGSTILLNRGTIDKIGLFDESFKRHQDLEYLIRFFRYYKLSIIKEPLVKIYGHNVPKAQDFVKIKKRYLSKFNNDINEFGNNIAKEIFAKQWLEVASAFANEIKIWDFVYYLKKSLSYKVLPLRNYFRILKVIIINIIKKIIFRSGSPNS